MILTGNEIYKEINTGRIVIDNFKIENLEPNSYGFLIGNKILEYTDYNLDFKKTPTVVEKEIPKDGFVLEPNKFYLASTYERMGSNFYAATLLADLSVSSMGMWIQHSAPLGHHGAIIPWTLEIRVLEKIRIYPFMKIGKIAFWTLQGENDKYNGKYIGSETVVASRFSQDFSINRKR
ncbi:deoxycytidine triphosphate deaminase [Lysinibacillus sphaericus]|uniref:Deoxycytidine triphosphate deaminase n=2 Tax=Lysinibacillus TaxID=400634 RepID=A0A2S0K0R3_LYSSH|nr:MULTISPECIES: deoxycytidine triphosphate deaminase [Lysinibacillus]AHN21961.1 deoxycytidine triphosphate deaminase [Lysinibacillus varians]AVK96834.1 deoxycytidine triphosphate deaminase [Lysinibacillus sphaericus]MED4545696.1 hypothetical protein [Lysinibacillus sphaericus]TKI16737.1 deoxycytidine triphosphate deaminase [Lysinibacillus sphaericus]TKI51042.1 deoxycytidine triphosphate deaminase [Lysinibacillus varians]